MLRSLLRRYELPSVRLCTSGKIFRSPKGYADILCDAFLPQSCPSFRSRLSSSSVAAKLTPDNSSQVPEEGTNNLTPRQKKKKNIRPTPKDFVRWSTGLARFASSQKRQCDWLQLVQTRQNWLDSESSKKWNAGYLTMQKNYVGTIFKIILIIFNFVKQVSVLCPVTSQ